MRMLPRPTAPIDRFRDQGHPNRRKVGDPQHRLRNCDLPFDDVIDRRQPKETEVDSGELLLEAAERKARMLGTTPSIEPLALSARDGTWQPPLRDVNGS